MAKDQNTFAKRQREMEKKRKAEAKLQRRRKKKEQVDDPDECDGLTRCGGNRCRGYRRSTVSGPVRLLATGHCRSHVDMRWWLVPRGGQAVIGAARKPVTEPASGCSPCCDWLSAYNRRAATSRGELRKDASPEIPTFLLYVPPHSTPWCPVAGGASDDVALSALVLFTPTVSSNPESAVGGLSHLFQLEADMPQGKIKKLVADRGFGFHRRRSRRVVLPPFGSQRRDLRGTHRGPEGGLRDRGGAQRAVCDSRASRRLIHARQPR